MNEELKQSLSDLMDGEVSSGSSCHVLEQLCADSDARAHWERMHLVRDVVQKEFKPGLLDAGFASRISDAIADEPVPAPVENVVAANFGARSNNKSDRQTRKWMRPVGGLAIAATVAAVSVMGLRYLQPTTPDAGFDQTIASQTSLQAPAIVPNRPSGNELRLVNNTGTYWTLDKQRIQNSELEKRLNGYLSDHIEFATMRNVGGMLPYSRIAGYDEVGR